MRRDVTVEEMGSVLGTPISIPPEDEILLGYRTILVCDVVKLKKMCVIHDCVVLWRERKG